MGSIKLFNLPDIVIKKVFSYLSFDEVSRLRVVNRDFNQVGKEVLNKGLVRVEKFHNMCLKEVRLQLPRRESERRTHPLARHVDVFMAIETRISMLSMTYAKYIDAGLTCFIPGKVLDEMYRLLRLVRGSECPPRPHEILQELRDISSMAMEHFDDKIAPELKQKLHPGVSTAGLLLVKPGGSRRHSFVLRPSDSGSVMVPHTSDDIQTLEDIRGNMKKAKASSVFMKKEIKALKSKVRVQTTQLVNQRIKIRENSAKLAEQGTQLAEMRRLLEEYGSKQRKAADTPSVSGIAELANKQLPRDCKRKASGVKETSGKKKRKL